MSGHESKSFQERLILPLGAKEIEFSVPICPSTPSRKGVVGWRSSAPQEYSPTSTSSSPSLRSESQHRNRSFSSAFLFPVGRSASPLLSPIPHTSCPSSPWPPSSPCPSPGPNSPFVSFFNRSFKISRSPSPSPVHLAEQRSTEDNGETSPVGGSSLYTLGTLNPDLYKSCHDLDEETQFPDGHLGRVWFSLDYDKEKEKLNIGLMRIRNLKTLVDSSTNCDPVVRVQLMPGERRYHQSTVQKRTCNPVYNETFGFHVHHSELADQSLKFLILDNARSRGRQTLGQVIYSLKHARLDAGRQAIPNLPVKIVFTGSKGLNSLVQSEAERYKPEDFMVVRHCGYQVIKEDLVKETPNSPSQTGEILIALCYIPSPNDRITVTVLQARNLKTAARDSPDTFTKVVLVNQTKTMKSKKTNVVKNSSEPCYNESFQFRLTKEQAESTSISISVHESPYRARDPPIGRLVLGGFMFARGRGLAHWSEVMARPKEHIQRWHPLPS